MHTYFARHTIGLEIDQATRDLLWNEQRVAIHYPEQYDGVLAADDNPSLNPDEYPGRSAGVLRVLLEMTRDGGFVCAQHHGREESIVGMVHPGTQIELISGYWSERSYPGRKAILKSVRLDRVKLVAPAQSAVILVGRPRQGTLMRWWRAGAAVQHLVEGTRAKPALDSLSPDQQEIMCSEFLRLDDATNLGLPRLVHLLLPVGRTMKDLDVYGLAADGRIIMAQVTLSALEEARGKLDRLQNYLTGARSHVVLFCRHDRLEQIGGVTVCPIEFAYTAFTEAALGQAWLEAALG